jgi:hypothetical protein
LRSKILRRGVAVPANKFLRRSFMKEKYKSEILGIIYKDAKARYEAGAMTEEEMQQFSNECLKKDYDDYKSFTKKLEMNNKIYF